MRRGKLNVDIREFTEKDLTELAVLEKACFADPWTVEMLKSESERDGFCCLLAETQGECVGLVYGNVLMDVAELYKVAVLPTFRAKGCGKALAESFISLVKKMGARQIFLEVRVSNQAALALYLGQGFEKTRQRKRYYADGEDCLEMKKSLYPDAE